jgi:phosphatidylglycerophosphate synthase
MAVPRNHLPGPHRFLTQSANLVSALRFILAFIWIAVFFGNRPHRWILRTIAISGAASDLLDGRIARWTNSAGRFGRWLDSVADIAFILTVLASETYAGVIPAYIPALVAASFTQYILDSVLIRGSTVPVKSRLGHWAGVFNYMIVILLAWAPPPRAAGRLIADFAPMVGLFYLMAIGERMLSYGIARRLLSQQPVSRCG